MCRAALSSTWKAQAVRGDYSKEPSTSRVRWPGQSLPVPANINPLDSWEHSTTSQLSHLSGQPRCTGEPTHLMTQILNAASTRKLGEKWRWGELEGRTRA